MKTARATSKKSTVSKPTTKKPAYHLSPPDTEKLQRSVLTLTTMTLVQSGKMKPDKATIKEYMSRLCDVLGWKLYKKDLNSVVEIGEMVAIRSAGIAGAK